MKANVKMVGVLAEAREKELRDQMSRERGAREEGKKEGKLEIARKLIQKGFSIADAADTTGLSVSEIEKPTS